MMPSERKAAASEPALRETLQTWSASLAIAGVLLAPAGAATRWIAFSLSGAVPRAVATWAPLGDLAITGAFAVLPTLVLVALFAWLYTRLLPTALAVDALGVALSQTRADADGFADRHTATVAKAENWRSRVRAVERVARAADAGLEEPLIAEREMQTLLAEGHALESELDQRHEEVAQVNEGIAALEVAQERLVQTHAILRHTLPTVLAPLLWVIGLAFAVTSVAVIPGFPQGLLSLMIAGLIGWWLARLGARREPITVRGLLPIVLVCFIAASVAAGIGPTTMGTPWQVRAAAAVQLPEGTYAEVGRTGTMVVFVSCATGQVSAVDVSRVLSMEAVIPSTITIANLFDLLNGSKPLRLGFVPRCP